jgi:hypothetical protein
MKKSESILKLEELGLNTLDYYITESKTETMHYLAKHADDLLSMRTERGDEFNCPFYYMMFGKALGKLALTHLDEGYKLIFAQSLDTKGCLAFGNIGLGESAHTVMEFVLGEGKCRELDNHKDKQTLFIPYGSMVAAKEKSFSGGKAYILNKIYLTVKDKCYDEIPCVVEWSYYDRPVGVKLEPAIYWECRPYA